MRDADFARTDWVHNDAALDQRDALIYRAAVAGPRYPEVIQRGIDTEEFA